MRPPRLRFRTVLLASFATLPAACSGTDEPPPRQITEEDIPPAARDSLTMDDLGGLEVQQIQLTIPWTSGSIDRPGQDGSGRSSVIRFELTEANGFDRLLLEFSDEGEFPGYQIRFTDEVPTLCAGGAATRATGRAHLLVDVGPVRVRSPDGSPTFDPNQTAPLPLGNVMGIEVICLENNRMDWVLGVGQRQPFRVLELRGPRRLVVDVGHPPF